jgi:hypothetical protein
MKARNTWRKDEVSQLLTMLERGATKMEIAQAFPYRTWTRLRAKISELKSKDFAVPGDKPMGSKESYAMYQKRLAKEQGEDGSRTGVPSMETNHASTMIEGCLNF